MSIYLQCSILLTQLELDLKRLGLFTDISPSAEQLNSLHPFAVDTLRFEQWLQFMFIPKMTMLVNTRAPLPPSMNILPMAEESFKLKNGTFNDLFYTIRQLDQLISNGG